VLQVTSLLVRKTFTFTFGADRRSRPALRPCMFSPMRKVRKTISNSNERYPLNFRGPFCLRFPVDCWYKRVHNEVYILSREQVYLAVTAACRRRARPPDGATVVTHNWAVFSKTLLMYHPSLGADVTSDLCCGSCASRVLPLIYREVL